MALSSRAHAFSVESLVGNSLKRKLEDTGEEKLRDRPDEMLKQPERPKHSEKEQSVETRAQRAKTRICPSPISPAVDSEGFQVELQGTDLWKRFHEIGTEMIITKAGRRMFPAVRVKIKGLEAAKQYYIVMDIIPVDSKRYRYVYHSSQWMVAGNTEQSPLMPRLYVHPDSPASGETWMKQIVSFDRVKLTNNDMDEKGHRPLLVITDNKNELTYGEYKDCGTSSDCGQMIILQSMHKYRPRVHVIVKEADVDVSVNQSLPANGVQTFAFPETEFTTVTAYQNQQITRLKIDRNPFAKGFRDPGRNRVGLERVMDNYPWRPVDCRPSLDFQAFNTQKPAGCSDSPLGTSCTGTPSSLSSVLSPSCSPPLFHVTAGSLGVTCRDTHLCNVDVPMCYKVGAGRSPGPQRFTLPAYDRLRYNSSPSEIFVTQRSPPLMFRFPSLSSLNALTANNAKSANCSAHDLQFTPSVTLSHLQMMHPGSTMSHDGQMHQDLYNLSARRPYSFYGYNLSAPSRLAAGPFKLMAQNTSPSPIAGTLVTERSFRDGKAGQWQQTVNHCL